MQAAIEGLLGRHGYSHYETSAFAREGARCAHNLNYWLFGDYIGIGAGAHAKLSFPDHVTREARYRQPRQYMRESGKGNAVQSSHEISAADLGFEFMMNALRLTDGFTTALYEARTGLAWSAVAEPVGRLIQRGLLMGDGSACRPTLLGRQFLNEMLMEFMAPSSVDGAAPGAKP